MNTKNYTQKYNKDEKGLMLIVTGKKTPPKIFK